MKTLKKIALALCIAASLGAVSTSVMAEADAGRITYAPAQAIDMVAAKVGEAITALEQGGDVDKVDALMKAALDSGKEINANDKVFAARDKVNTKVKSARKHLKEGATQEAEQELRDAQKGYLALKSLI
jgi:vacuolar-type H+-ATPase subunit E/Vma4